MKVKQLKKFLEKLDDENLVVLSKDREGNNFSPLANCSLQIYAATAPWCGDIYEVKLTGSLRAQGFTEDDLYHGKFGKKAIVLWPTN